MLRREFLGGLGLAAATWPVAARAQQPMPVIGYLSSGSAQGFSSRLEAFRAGLQETGFHEGQNVAIEYRWAEGKEDRLAAMAAELVQRGVNVLATPGGIRAAMAAKQVTSTIPIVFETGADPVAAGLVGSLSRPEKNVTGVTSLNVEVGPKRFEILKQLLPARAPVVLLINPANPNAGAVVEESRGAANALNLDLHILEARGERDFDGVFAKVGELRAGGMVLAPDPLFISASNRLAALTIRHRIIAIFHTREFVAAGGLLSYGGSTAESHRQAGIYTGRILMGKKPTELPIQQITKVELSINLGAAKALGLTIPSSLVARADEVIE